MNLQKESERRRSALVYSGTFSFQRTRRAKVVDDCKQKRTLFFTFFIPVFMLTFSEPFTVYTLKCNDGTYYTGCTSDLADRLKRHNRGSVPATKNRRPVELITYTAFFDKYKAFYFEKYLKSGSGRAFLKRHLI
jgi:predicted GIY-YIG superfamily endonuclease